jgi:hypothetical protein
MPEGASDELSLWSHFPCKLSVFDVLPIEFNSISTRDLDWVDFNPARRDGCLCQLRDRFRLEVKTSVGRAQQQNERRQATHGTQNKAGI